MFVRVLKSPAVEEAEGLSKDDYEALKAVKENPDDKMEQVVKVLECYRGAKDLPIFLNAHVCGLRCLCQPTLTRVCSQIRSESLLLFYAVNRFHFELLRGSVDVLGGNKVALPLASRWWRSVGDSNLRQIANFSINFYGDGKAFQEGFEMSGQQSPSELTLTLRDGPPATKLHTKTLQEWRGFNGSVIDEKRKTNWDLATGILEYGAQIEEGGLFVRGIELLLKSIWQKNYSSH